MNSLFTPCLILYACFSLPVTSALAQSTPGDSTFQSANDHAIAVFHSYLGEQSPIYNGTGNNPDGPTVKGFSYFQAQEPATGSVVYDGTLFSNLPLLYDIVLDQVIVVDNDGYLIGLFMNRVREFSVHGHHFLNTPRGVYDQLTAGAITIMARRTKMIQDEIVNLEVVHPVVAKDYFYAVKDGVYYELHNRKNLLALMNDKKKEVKEFIRAGRIKFRKDPEGAYCKIAAYYNQLSK